MRQAQIYRKDVLAGILTEDGGEYQFGYDEAYLKRGDAQPVSLTLPLQAEIFVPHSGFVHVNSTCNCGRPSTITYRLLVSTICLLQKNRFFSSEPNFIPNSRRF